MLRSSSIALDTANNIHNVRVCECASTHSCSPCCCCCCCRPAQRSNQFKRIGQQQERSRSWRNLERSSSKAFKRVKGAAPLPLPLAPLAVQYLLNKANPCLAYPTLGRGFNCDHNYAAHWLVFLPLQFSPPSLASVSVFSFAFFLHFPVFSWFSPV